MCALFSTFILSYSSAKHGEIGQHVTVLRSSIDCHVLWTTKCSFIL